MYILLNNSLYSHYTSSVVYSYTSRRTHPAISTYEFNVVRFLTNFKKQQLKTRAKVIVT